MSAHRGATDRERISPSEEFVWEEAGLSGVHDYVAPSILKRLRAAGAKTILDLGCGNGAFTGMLGSAGFDVTGVDHSQSGIALAKAQFPAISFAQHDLARPLGSKYTGQFDAVVSVEVIEHLLLPRRLMQSALEALRPGGLLIVTTPFHGYWKNLALALAGRFDAHWHPLRDYGHIKFFSRRTLLWLVAESGFEGPVFDTVGRIPPLARSMIVSATKPR